VLTYRFSPEGRIFVEIHNPSFKKRFLPFGHLDIYDIPGYSKRDKYHAVIYLATALPSAPASVTSTFSKKGKGCFLNDLLPHIGGKVKVKME
jgi:hypothetical protein